MRIWTLLLAGIPPILLNAIIIPLIIKKKKKTYTLYFVFFFEFLLTQSVWILGLGIPLILGLNKIIKT
jgi:hypothetical protein